jgi:hypothetical protein
MTKTELFELLDKLETENWGEKGLRYEVGESFEGVQYIRFEVDDDDGDKLLSAATDDEIIAFADHEGYTLTVEDCQAIREGERDGETIREAVNALIEEEDEDEN